jgi:hypothetical protein
MAHNLPKKLTNMPGIEQGPIPEQPMSPKVKHAFEMDDPFKAMQAQENENLQTAKELFNEKNGMKLKSELSSDEVTGFSRVKFISHIFAIPALDTWADEFLMLRVSLKRKGRLEFLEAIKKPVDMMPKMGIFGGGQKL